MRKLMWIALGLTLMCAVSAYLGSTVAIYVGIGGFLTGISALVFGRKKIAAKIVALLCVGLMIGFAVCYIYDFSSYQYARQMEDRTISLSAQVKDYSFDTDFGCAAVVNAEVNGKRFDAQLYFNEKMNLKPGDCVEGVFRLDYTGGQDGTYHFGKGILLLGYQKGDVIVEPVDRIPPAYFGTVLRNRIIAIIDQCFNMECAAFAKALLLGDRTDIGYELNNAFRVTGISHIVAVSGMHVSILASAIYLLAAKRRWLMAILGVPLVILFAAVAGFTPSVTRACIMQVLLLGALILDRDYDPLTSLAFAAGVMLCCNPSVITSVSFQLSFGCMAGIFLFSAKVYRRLALLSIWKNAKRRSFVGRIRRWIAASISVTLGAMVFTTPLCAVYFGAVSLISLLTNLLVLWAVSIIFPGIILVCILSAVWFPLGSVLAGIVSYPIIGLTAFVKMLSQFPLAAVYTQSVFVVIWLAWCYFVFVVFLFLKKKSVSMLISAFVIELCFALLLSWFIPKTDQIQMTVLDVGQGQCVILYAEDRTYVVDCGGDYDDAAADFAADTLMSKGIYRIDGLILTHFDRDHAGGAAYFLSRIHADHVIVPPSHNNSEIQDAITSVADISVSVVNSDIRMDWDTCCITIFAPVLANSDNESGISVLFSRENYDILITGDMNSLGEALLLSSKDIPDIEALVVGHHGSKHSTSQRLLYRLLPEVAFISVGKDNSYGHPSPEVISRLTDCGCEIRRTDQEGTIVFRR